MGYTAWFKNLPIPWLVGGPVGQLYWDAVGSVFDDQADQYRQAVKARFPTRAPSDGLKYIGDDRLLVRGPQESDADYVKRLLDAWSQWKYGGHAAGLLPALYFAGFGDNVVCVQQNGLGYELDPTNIYNDLTNLQDHTPRRILGHDPRKTIGAGNTLTITITTAGIVGVARYSATINGVVFATSQLTHDAWQLVGGGSDYAPLTRLRFDAGTYVLNSTYAIASDGTLTLAGGAIDGLRQQSAPWWLFDLNDYFCSRFALLIDAGGSGPFTTFGTATFVGTEDGSPANPWPLATWNNPFLDTSYKALEGVPIVTSPNAPVICVPDSTTKSRTGIRVAASASFVGRVDLVAYTGDEPFAEIRSADLQRLRLVLRLWRPAKATCVGIYVLTQGKFIGWPPRSIGDTSLGTTIGPSAVVYFSPT